MTEFLTQFDGVSSLIPAFLLFMSLLLGLHDSVTFLVLTSDGIDDHDNNYKPDYEVYKHCYTCILPIVLL